MAVIVADVFAETAVVATEKVAVVAPAATVTELGTVALVALDLRLTTIPPVGAAPVSVTVPVDATPPTTDAGERLSLLRVGAVIARATVAEADPELAVIVDDVEAATATVDTVKVAVVDPAATVTLAGTVALVLLDLRFTTKPVEGAAVVSVTVPVLDTPPATEVGLRVTELTEIGLTVTTAVRGTLL